MKIQKISAQIIFAAIFLLSVVSVSAQTDKEANTRSITSLDFQAQRPKGGVKGSVISTPKSVKRKKNIAVVSNSKRRYKLTKKIPSKSTVTVKPDVKIDTGKGTTKTTVATTFKTEELGVTFWRLRPKIAEEDDDAPTFAVKANNQVEYWTAERVNSTTKFRKGDKVRFTIESSRSGYIYIVNREFYADGTSGDADLIFPTLKTRSGGDNRVTAGSLIEIPGSEVQFPYFNVNPKRDDYVGEELLVIITPEKLPGIEIGLRAIPVKDEMVKKWLSEWSAEVDIFDAEDGEGIAQTQAEAQAATTNSRSLTQEEPLPQTIYRVRINTKSPLLVPFQMQAVR